MTFSPFVEIPLLFFYADHNFSIKCGGPSVTTSDGITYERDNETLGPATYFVTDTNRWAVSNVGLLTGNSNPIYPVSVNNVDQLWTANLSQFTGIVDLELFKTARNSGSSLRYYGLGLENGDYNITLQFAETSIQDSTTTWKSLGRRVFDIYIQV